jgi:hypothetical protein
VLACLLFPLAAGYGQVGEVGQPVVYYEDFNDGQAQGWELERGWKLQEDALVGRAHFWARYLRGHWKNMSLFFSFNVLRQGMHANVRVSEIGRYAVGFRVEDDQIHIYLFKEFWNVQPTVFRDLVAEHSTRFQPRTQGLQGGIEVNNGTIRVRINNQVVLSVVDPAPLPAGSIAFETLNDGFAMIDDIVVRAERRLIEVPDVIGNHFDVASNSIINADLSIGEVAEKSSDAAPRTVVEQRPQPGSKVPPETRVDLVLSSGPQMVEVPSLIGMNRRLVVEPVRRAGLVVGAIRERTSDAESGTVVQQEPPPRARVPLRTPVNLWVAVSFPLTRVPDLRNHQLGEVSSILQRAKLQLGRVTERVANQAVGTVLHQEPAPDIRVPLESMVSIVIAKKKKGDIYWVFPAIGSGILGLLLGYWIGSRKGNHKRTAQGHAPRVSIRVRKDVGEQIVEPFEGLRQSASINFRVVSDAGKQHLDSQGPLIP